jgi:hypothetical protein
MPPTEQEICAAIKMGLCVSLSYDGHDRVVEPHLLGIHKTTKNLSLRCYQIEGGSRTGNVPAWKLMLVKQIANFSVTNKRSLAPRPGYNYQDKHIQMPAKCCV